MTGGRTGSCLCGQVQFRVKGHLRPVVACPCSQCRKTSGHFVAATSAVRGDVSIDGTVTWYAFSSKARRGFCATCGSSLFWDGPCAHLSIHAGWFDGPTGLRLAGHMFCATKGEDYDIGGELPKSARHDPRLTTTVLS